jgi:predicted ATPase
MTEQEFKTALDQVVLKGINEVGASTVLGALAIVSRFTEVVYDMDVVERVQRMRESKAEVQEVNSND